MANELKLPESVAAEAARILAGVPVPQKDVAPTAAMVSGLLADMGPMRRMDVGENEPATTYDASAT
jgi:hypothetical protein